MYKVSSVCQLRMYYTVEIKKKKKRTILDRISFSSSELGNLFSMFCPMVRYHAISSIAFINSTT